MGLFDRLGDRLRDIKGDYDIRQAEEAAIQEEERKLIRDYSLKRTGQTGRYLVDDDHIIEINLRSPASIQAARDALDEYQRNPKIRRVSKAQAKEIKKSAGSGSRPDPLGDIGRNFNANFADQFSDFGGLDDYDFITGETRTPQKKRRKSNKK
ncbi:MAG: hypothetical protein GX837_04255 [Methanomicrobiales archaeon]|nr:hypothetical protein [Methanomicrobiales archaeon]